MEASAIANPSAVYCQELGHRYETRETPAGDVGVCIFYDGTECGAWAFLRGECGAQYSYCKILGMDTEVREDGEDPFSSKYAVCVPKTSGTQIKEYGKREGKPVTELIGLLELSSPAGSDEYSPPEAGIQVYSLSGLLKPQEESLPSYFDWRDKDGKNWMTPVRDQGGCGSCWAHGTLGSIEALIKIKRNDSSFDIDLSEQDLVSCSGAGTCAGGSPEKSLQYIAKYGVTDESCLPYVGWDLSCSHSCAGKDRRLWKVDSYVYLDGSSAEDIKKQLVENGPIISRMFPGGMRYDSDGIGHCNYTSGGGHAVVLVGYNESGKYWLLKNSWGADYRDGGYFKLGYGECSASFYLLPVLSSKPFTSFNAAGTAIVSGNDSGKLSDLNAIDGAAFSLHETCSLNTSCSGSSARIYFNAQGLSNTTRSVELTAMHNGSGYNLSFYNRSAGAWVLLGAVPTGSQGRIVKHTLCDTVSSCALMLDGNLTFAYVHAAGQGSIDSAAVDLFVAESLNEEYCRAYINYSSANWYIRNVSLNVSGQGYTGVSSSSSYSNYSDYSGGLLATLGEGRSYNLTVSVSSTTSAQLYLRAWIDYDLDGVFSEDEKIDLGNASFTGARSFGRSFTVPSFSAAKTRMRIFLGHGSVPSACGSSRFGEVEDYSVNFYADEVPPTVTIGYGLGYVPAGGTARLSASIFDWTGIDYAYAQIESPDENVLALLPLFDDGNHGDGRAGDGVYGNQWTTPADEKDYLIDYVVGDVKGYNRTYDNLDQFTSFQLHNGSVLLVDDTSGSQKPAIGYYLDAILSAGYDYSLWNSYLRGSLDLESMKRFKAVVWSNPYSTLTNTTLISKYLGSGGGRFFISGQGLQQNGNDTFFKNYMKAEYTNLSQVRTLGAVSGDPISNGMNITLFGAGGANNQGNTRVVNPIAPAESVFDYAKINSTLTAVFRNGSGAVRFDKGTYKTVYFAFGFEAINSSDQRIAIMRNALRWLDVPDPSTTTTTTSTRASTSTTTKVVTTSSSTSIIIPSTSSTTSTKGTTTTTPPVPLAGDATGDGHVDYADLVILAGSYDKRAGESGYDVRADFDGNAEVGYSDLLILAVNYGT